MLEQWYTCWLTREKIKRGWLYRSEQVLHILETWNYIKYLRACFQPASGSVIRFLSKFPLMERYKQRQASDDCSDDRDQHHPILNLETFRVLVSELDTRLTRIKRNRGSDIRVAQVRRCYVFRNRLGGSFCLLLSRVLFGPSLGHLSSRCYLGFLFYAIRRPTSEIRQPVAPGGLAVSGD